MYVYVRKPGLITNNLIKTFVSLPTLSYPRVIVFHARLIAKNIACFRKENERKIRVTETRTYVRRRQGRYWKKFMEKRDS